MNYLNLVLRTIKNHAFMFVLVLVELATLFLAVNYAVSTIYDRQMLTKPFVNILDVNSSYVYDANFFEESHGNLFGALSSRQKILDKLDGEYDIYDVMVYYGEGGFNVISVSDELYLKLKLPLISGNRSGAVGGNISTGKRTVLFGETPIEFNITGKLTAPSYIPMMSAFQSSDTTTKDLFTNSDEMENFILTDRSSISGLESHFIANLGFIIKFHENSEENMKLLEASALTARGTTIIENSTAALRDDLSDFLILFGCVSVIVIIGVISISVIVYLHNERQSGILWICGYSKKQILISHAANMLVILTASIGVSAAVYGVLSALGNETANSVTLGGINIFATIILYLVLGVLSLIIPAVKIAKKTPVEYLRRVK